MDREKNEISEKTYAKFIKYFPFSCVDLLIFFDEKILLTKRTRNPYKGKWHLPGSLIRKNEIMIDAVRRCAKKELNLDVKIEKYLGVYESLNQFRHDISHGFIVSVIGGKIKTDFQAKQLQFFKRIPSDIVPHHKKMISEARNFLM